MPMLCLQPFWRTFSPHWMGLVLIPGLKTWAVVWRPFRPLLVLDLTFQYAVRGVA